MKTYNKNTTSAYAENKAKKGKWVFPTHRESAQLPRPALPIHLDNLRRLARDAQHAAGRLQRRQRLRIHDPLVEQRVARRRQPGDPRCGASIPALEMQNERGDGDVLDGDQGRLAVGAEREPIPGIVRQADDVGAGLEEVGEERDALGALGAEELDQLRDLDDGGGADDADAETLADGELEAFRVIDRVDVLDQLLVALWPQQREAGVVDGARQVVRDGLEEAAGLDEGGVHDGQFVAGGLSVWSRSCREEFASRQVDREEEREAGRGKRREGGGAAGELWKAVRNILSLISLLAHDATAPDRRVVSALPFRAANTRSDITHPPAKWLFVCQSRPSQTQESSALLARRAIL